MRLMIRRLSALRRSQAGATAIEYGLIAALICVAAVGAFSSMGGSSGSLWGRVDDAVAEASGR